MSSPGSRSPAAHPPEASDHSVRLALACSGIGHVRRGFESITQSLFENVRGSLQATLFKGAGPDTAEERTVSCLHRTSLLGRTLGWVSEREVYKLECSTFARRLVPALVEAQSDVVFVPDLPTATRLAALRRRLPPQDRFAILFHNSSPYRPAKLASFDFDLIQQVTAPAQERALREGLDRSRLLPIPIDLRRFRPGPAAAGMRKELGIPDDACLILCAAAHTGVKRLDLLIESVAAIPPVEGTPPVLLIAGQDGEETATLKRLGERCLGHRVIFRSYTWEQMPEVYRMADLFALISLWEGFGMVLLEAMATGLPVVSQDDTSRRWIVADGGVHVACERDGTLTEALHRLVTDADERRRIGEAGHRRVRSSFSWDVLLPIYLDTFEEARRLRARS